MDEGFLFEYRLIGLQLYLDFREIVLELLAVERGIVFGEVERPSFCFYYQDAFEERVERYVAGPYVQNPGYFREVVEYG